MKKILLFALITSITLIIGCKNNDDDGGETDFDYHVHIAQPTTDDKHVNDALQIEIEFESHTNETIHHIKVRIYNKLDNTEIYNKPSTAHVHEESGSYKFSDSFDLTGTNGVMAHTDWVLEAKVWGHDAGIAEEIEMVEFHVHPE